jgi:hypothetical protein
MLSRSRRQSTAPTTFHGDERRDQTCFWNAPYVFRTIDRLNRPWEAVDRTLADSVSSYWANFAKEGDPNGPGLPRWPEYVPGSHITMQLGARLGTLSVAEGSKRDFFLGQLQKPGSQP